MAALPGSLYFCANPSTHFNRNAIHQKIRLAIAVWVLLVFAGVTCAVAQSKAATATSFTVTSGGSSVSSVPAGTVVALSATVSSGATSVTLGVISFCESSAKSCTGIHLLGTIQLNSAGKAVLKMRPGIGSHSYKAVFAGTNSYSGSSSSVLALTVTGTIPPVATTTSISQTGAWGAYRLTSTVTETGNTAPPTGSVSFQDSNHANAVLGTGTLSAPTRDVAWLTANTTVSGVAGVSYVVADLNRDGIPDLFIKDYFGTYDVLLGNGDGTFRVQGSPFGPYSQTGSFVVGDFNNDGIPDVAAVNAVYYAANNTITIFLGNGDGTFTIAASSPAIGMSPNAIATADVNGDGNADLVLSQQVSSNGEVVVLLGNGSGGFTQTQASVSMYTMASLLIPADLNGDGKVDLIAVGASPTETSVLIGNGDGTFTVESNPGLPAASRAAVADVDDDGVLDVIVGPNDFSVYTGNGDGTFSLVPAGPNANFKMSGFAVGDLNQDGIPDIVYAAPYVTAVGVLFGNGDGTFVQAAGTIAYPYDFSGTFVVADFNGDGWPDILTEDGNSRTVIDSLTTPTETATASATVSLPLAGTHLAAAAYPGDSNYKASTSGTIPLWGVPPATSTSLGLTSAGSVVTSVAPGTVITLTATVAAGANPLTAGQVEFCDAATVSCSDIHLLGTSALSSSGTAVFKFVPGAGTHSYKAVFIENGYGLSSSSNAVSLTVGPAPRPVYTDATSISSQGYPGDYSLTAAVVGYGGTAPVTGKVSFLDTTFANKNLGTVSLGSSTPGTGWLISPTQALGYAPLGEVQGDFNRDGIGDLALLWSSGQYGDGPYSISILLGKGDGTFNTGPTFSTGIANQINPYMSSGDFNGDGKSDLAILSWNTGGFTSYVTTFLSNGDRSFAAARTNVAYNQGVVGGDGIPGSMVAADFNGDGKLDVAVVGDYISFGGVSILLGNGDGTFKAGTSFATSGDYGRVAVSDLNGDGIPDLVVTNYFEFGGSPTIFLGKGDGTFTSKPASFTLDYFPTSVVVGDFNRDGVLDLAFSDLSGVEIALGNGDGTFKETAASPIVPPSELSSLVIGDFNHDGKLDIAGVDDYNDRIVLLIGAGDGSFTVTPTTPVVSPNWLGPFAVVAADFNGDGVPDLAMLDKYQTNASILLTEPTETATGTVDHVAPIGAGTHAVKASYAGDSNYPASVSSTINLDAGLAPVVISPPSGTYSTVQTLTMSESVPGSTIYYSAYGVLNTNGFVPYTGPITLAQGGQVTITAYASETGYVTSNYVTATYNLKFPVTPAPSISPTAGYYAGPQTVTIADSDSSAKIYYTTNGTIPTSTSNLYSGPISVNGSETVVAVALSYGGSLSVPVSAQYVIGSSSTPLIYSIAGTGVAGYSGDGGPASLAQITGAAGMVKDANSNLYFSDETNHMVRKIAAGTGVISVVAGNGYYGSSGDGGAATSAALSYPATLALDGSSLYFVDLGSETIRKVDLTTGIITTVAGNGTCLISGDGGPATAAGICGVYGLAVDASHNLYLASANTIRQVKAGTGIITAITGTTYGYSGDGGPVSSAGFATIDGLAFDASGNLYLADAGNQLIRKITATGGVITASSIVSTVAGTPPRQNSYPIGGYSGDGGPAISALLNGPLSIALDGSGNLFIADRYNNVIREVAASTQIISTVIGNGLACASNGDGGAATSASLCFPTEVMADGSSNIYVADSISRIREMVVASTPPSTRAATPTFSVQGGDYATAQTLTITDATPGASIYVTVDGSAPSPSTSPGYSVPFVVTGNITVKAVAVAPGFLTSAPVSATYNIAGNAPIITTVAGSGTYGTSTNGTPASDLKFRGAEGLAIDKSGNLYVSDTIGCAVWKISASTGTGSIFAGTGNCNYNGDGVRATDAALSYPEGLAFDATGNLFIADQGNGLVRRIAASDGVITTVAGQYPPPFGNVGDGGPATSAYLSGPASIAFDSNGNLYITDSGNARVRKVSATTGIISTFAGNGTSGVSGDGGPATSAALQYPTSVALDSAGNIYVASLNGGRIRKIAVANGQINTIAGLKDLRGDLGDGGPALGNEIAPRSLTLDANDNLYISNDPSEIRKVDLNSGVITRVAGIGFPGYSGDGGVATAAQIVYPQQIAFDSVGNLYFLDGAGRIRKVILVTQTAATPTFTPGGGSYASVQSVTISSTTTGATIYYTTDGTTPTANSNVYASPITVTASETIKAIAVAAGYTQSAVASGTYSITVPPPTFTISGTAVSVTKGATTGNTSTITLQPSNGFSGSITLTAEITSSPSGAQYPPTLSFGTTSPAAITGSSAGTATLTITTTAATSAANHAGPSLWLTGGGFTLACMLLWCIPARRQDWKALVGSMALLLALGALGACGGGSGAPGGGGGGGGGTTGTTSGTYVITVTGTSGSVTQTGAINLTVR